MSNDYLSRSISWIGLIMIILGGVLILFPYLARIIPAIEKAHPILVYVYRNDNFIFITSPLSRVSLFKLSRSININFINLSRICLGR